MELQLITPDNQAGSPVSVSDVIFGKEFNKDLVHQVVVAYQAAGRQGSVAQKTRSEVSGGGAKPWRQKGMGRARAGTTRGPIWVGGGRAFAAKPRSYTQKVNKKMYRAAICSILSRLASDNKLNIVGELSVESAKTKLFKEQLSKLGVTGSALIIGVDISENLYLAARNLLNINIIDVTRIDPVSLLNFDQVLLTQEALKAIEERF